jgi:hypothetical protein
VLSVLSRLQQPVSLLRTCHHASYNASILPSRKLHVARSRMYIIHLCNEVICMLNVGLQQWSMCLRQSGVPDRGSDLHQGCLQCGRSEGRRRCSAGSVYCSWNHSHNSCAPFLYISQNVGHEPFFRSCMCSFRARSSTGTTHNTFFPTPTPTSSA